ncbi:hypothetical protein PAPYR_2464 [Paratrimastix pyriformis]|uniref:Uncharacterized protein n=1 Tax=Paratrimastix pyriformis TaxID=342808 RepID=A0ABQ8UTH0_9EUKA|nr:hypothetical protein PAPYR_2464 [Paratrimastix pyriformis]
MLFGFCVGPQGAPPGLGLECLWVRVSSLPTQPGGASELRSPPRGSARACGISNSWALPTTPQARQTQPPGRPLGALRTG